MAPYSSDKQRKFFHTDTAKKAGITGKEVKEFDKASKGMSLPEAITKKHEDELRKKLWRGGYTIDESEHPKKQLEDVKEMIEATKDMDNHEIVDKDDEQKHEEAFSAGGIINNFDDGGTVPPTTTVTTSTPSQGGAFSQANIDPNKAKAVMKAFMSKGGKVKRYSDGGTTVQDDDSDTGYVTGVTSDDPVVEPSPTPAPTSRAPASYSEKGGAFKKANYDPAKAKAVSKAFMAKGGMVENDPMLKEDYEDEKPKKKKLADALKQNRK